MASSTVTFEPLASPFPATGSVSDLPRKTGNYTDASLPQINDISESSIAERDDSSSFGSL